jgi:PAS domain S-box-containing protein
MVHDVFNADDKQRIDILVVDDRPDDLLVAAAVLDDPRYILTTASSGSEALRTLLQTDFACIVLDVRLPGMDGFELAGLIRQRERTAHTPILFVTAEASDVGAIYRGYAVGAVDYLLKPVNPDILRAKVAVFVEMFDKDRRIREQTRALLDAERQHRELELAKLQLDSARRYRALADAIPQIVWTTDATGNTTYLNRRWGEITDLPYDPRHPAPWLDSVFDEDRIGCRDRFVLARADGAPFEIECRLRCGDRGLRWHLLRAVPERSPNGDVVGWLGTLTDIDDLRRARSRDAAARLRSEFLADASAALAGSPSWARGVRGAAEIAIATVCDACVVDITITTGATAPAPQAEGRTVIAQDSDSARAVLLEDTWRSGDGPIVDRAELVPDVGVELWPRVVDVVPPALVACGLRAAVIAPVSASRVRGSVTLMTAGAGGYDLDDLAVAADVAGRIAAAIDRALVHEKAERAIQARDEFLSIASHELRTPLSALLVQLGSVERTLDDKIPVQPGVDRIDKVRGKVAAALRHTNRLTGLVDSLLDVSRLATRGLVIQPEPCDLADVVREVAERFADEARRAGCELRLDVPGEVTGKWDRVRLEQVVTNLVSNAIKYGAGRPIDMAVDRVGAAGDARLVVRDHGIGIAEDDRARIFDRFERAAPSRNYGGLGLGLYITREIVDAHGGAISVESRPGDGATFTVVLPEEAASR